jgi:polysaccharide biosynthesis transport protein
MVNGAADEQSFLYDLLLKGRRRKLLITLTTISLFAIFSLAIQVLPQSYTTVANVEVEAQTPRAVHTQDIMRDLPFDDSTMGTEMALLESDTLYLDVVKQIGLDNNSEFNPSLRHSIVQDYIHRLQSIIDKWILARPAIEFDPATKRLAETLVELRKHVKVSQVTRSRMIQVSVTSHSNGTAQNIANALADLYVANHLDYRAQLSARAHQFVTQRLDELRHSAAIASQTVEKFRSEYGLMSGKDSTILQEQVTAVSLQLLAAKAKVAAAEGEYKATRLADPEQLSKVLTSEAMARLRDQEAAVASKRSALMTSYGENHPAIGALTAQLAGLRGQLGAEAQRSKRSLPAELTGATNTVAILAAQLSGLKDDMTKTDASRARLVTLEDEARTQRELYMAFLQRSKETDEGLQFPATSVRVAAHALIPMKASFPNNILMLPGALFISFILSSGFGLWLEARRKGVVTRSEVESLISIPSLGMLPIQQRGSLALFEDAMEDLWNRLSAGSPHVILITSALPAEGKTVVARALVETATKRHIRALLVDADMRSKYARPQGIKERSGVGLGDILSGAISATDAIADYTARHRLDAISMLPVGRVTDNPTRLLSQTRFTELISELKRDYPLIVVDAPPSLVGGDAAKLAQLADLTVMVARWNSTTPDEISAGLRQLRLTPSEGKLAGILLNRVNPRHTARYDTSDALLFANLYHRKYH